MQTIRMKSLTPAPAALLTSLMVLAGCGESDLPAHHEAVLACAEIEQAGGSCDGDSNEPASGAANPSSSRSPFADEPAGALAPGEEPVQGIDLSGYSLIMADEFQGEAIDVSRWKTAYEWGPDLIINGEQQYYIDAENQPGFGHEPFVLDGETLTIQARRTPDELLSTANGQPWLSGVLSSATRFEVQYGYIEARVDLPEGTGLWPAFWMLASDLDGLKPRTFIAEYDGARPDAIFHDYQYEDEDGNVRSPGQFQVDQPRLADGFHTLGISWTPEELVYYVDGVARYRVIGDRLPQQPMYLVLNLAIGGVWVDEPDDSTPDRPALVIDYVRVWQRDAG